MYTGCPACVVLDIFHFLCLVTSVTKFICAIEPAELFLIFFLFFKNKNFQLNLLKLALFRFLYG